MNRSQSVLRYGSPDPLPELIALRAGPLEMVYEAGDLRYVRLGEREVLRRVYVAVRDRNWGTVPAVLSNIMLDAGKDSFRITYDAEHRQGEIAFAWRATIAGESDGTLRFALDGEALSSFLRNRIGFCVLHPARECPGVPVVVEHADGTVVRGEFPRLISPHQPFMEMRSIAHRASQELWAEVRFEGEIFEMEDQRNWTDASFKTYCTPLRLPYPVEIRAGTRVEQAVTLTLREGEPPGERGREGAFGQGLGQQGDWECDRPLARAPAPEPRRSSNRLGRTLALPGVERCRHQPPTAGPSQTGRGSEVVSITIDRTSAAKPLPLLGLGFASHGEPLTGREMEWLRGLTLAHLRVDVRFGQPDWREGLRRASQESRQLGAALEIALHLTDTADRELAEMLALLVEMRPIIARWLVFGQEEKATSERWLRLARQSMASFDASIPIGSGTDANFTELNRRRPPVELLDMVCYSINPQVHAFDNGSLVETLAAQAATVESARQFAGDLPIVISPVTLRPRFNPDATGPEPEPAPGELPSAVDPRQLSLFGAGWTVGSLKYLAESGVGSVTYYETTGWRGVMETERGSRQPERFPSRPGSVFPLYHVLADVGEFAGGEVVRTLSGQPLRAEGLSLRRNGRSRVLLASFSPFPIHVTLRGLSGELEARFMDERCAGEAMNAPEAFGDCPKERMWPLNGELKLEMLPYSVARLDGTC